VAGAQAGAVVGVVADAVGLVLVADAALPAGADRVVARAAKVGDAAVRAAVGGVKAKAATAKADAEMVEASSSRT
jgi:hypothetical protein